MAIPPDPLNPSQSTPPSEDSKCDKCNDKGGGGRVVRRGINVFEWYCECPLGIQRKADHQLLIQQAENTEHDLLIVKAWEQSGIPKRFKDLRLETSPHSAVLEIEGIRVTEGVESWFLYGEVSRGKTGLAVGMAYALLEAGTVAQILFVSVPDLLSELRDTYSDDSASELTIIKRYADVELLILDDLGAEQSKNTEWIQDRLYQIIGKRHAEMLPTIFTSNLSLPDLGANLGARIAWRIREAVGRENIVEINRREFEG
jgi:DNA replication protein DnaC